MGAFVDTLRTLSPVRLAITAGVVLASIAFFAYLITRMATPQMSLLYADLAPSDSGEIVKQLEAAQIPYELGAQGTEIYVPQDQALRLRVSMAEQGLPSGGSVGYEIFDSADTLGTTSFVQNVNLVRALEGELARTISTIQNVKNARVHLVLPRRELFSKDRQQPSASIVLDMRSAGRLSQEQVLAIQHMVAAAVPGLTPTRVSVVDEKGSLLARGFDEIGGVTGEGPESKQAAYENRIARTIESLIEKTVGYGKVRAEVHADMDFDKVTTSRETFDPDGQVVRSTQTVEEAAQSENQETEQPVTVANNLPDVPGDTGTGVNSTENETRSEETVNYEISKQVTNTIREGSQIRRLSVAVLVDGNYQLDAQGAQVYTPRDQAELDQIAALVRSAMGFDVDRGDVLEVVNMQFVELDAGDLETDEIFLGLKSSDLLRFGELAMLSLVGLLVLLLIVRPLLSRAMEGDAMGVDGELALEAAGGAPALSGPGARPALTERGEATEEDELEDLIDIDRVEGRVKASSVKKVGEIVDKHPEEALSIVRNWMYQET
ncbi:MAG: flagellar basal-body MS-ring/collar protein FliF [Magnetospiraceae bacterium]